MKKRNGGEPEVAALRQCISGLSAAILCISGSLEVGTVMQEVVDSARALTGAGRVTTSDSLLDRV